jgi:predicted acyl esterase
MGDVLRALTGDRLRFDITSSNVPRLARNLNTGAPFAMTSKIEVAHQTIHVNMGYPSHIAPPFIPR